MSAPEFSRRYRLDAIGERAQSVAFEADADERAALAMRFDLVELSALSGEAAIARVPTGITAKGKLRAEVVQSCVASGAPLPLRIDEPFELEFRAEDPTAEEIELTPEDCDIMAHDGQAIDLGEALAQTLALALDPFPRAPGADALLRDAGVLSEEEAGPFGALAGLRAKLQKPA